MPRALQLGLLWLYRRVFAEGLLRYGWGQRLFFQLYDAYKLCFEAGPISQLQSLIPQGALAVDVGANVGFFTRRLARWVGETGHVFAIEPEDVNFAELTRRLASEGLSKRVTTIKAVADRTPGEARLAINKDHPGDHKIGGDGVPVRAVALDSLLAGELRNTAFIKIDVQGAEMRVLAGAQDILKRDRPALFVEVDPAALSSFGSSTDELLDVLSQFGYEPHTLEHSGPRRLDVRALPALLGRRSYVDLLFIASGVR